MTEENFDQLGDILGDSISDYSQNMDNMSESDWLKGYLSDKMPDKTPEEIETISSSIIDTIDVRAQKQAEMKAALEKGQSVESWFAQDMMSNGLSSGETAKRAAECCAAMQDPEHVDAEIVSQGDWSDKNWNKYKLKDTLTSTAKMAGTAALQSMGNDLYRECTEKGLKSVVQDKHLIKETLLSGAAIGVKTAAAGAMEIAQEKGLLPQELSPVDFANAASQAVEDAQIMERVAKGELTPVEASIEMQNVRVAAVASMASPVVVNACEKIGTAVGTAVGAFFNPALAKPIGFVAGKIGRFLGTKVAEKIVEKAPAIYSAAKTAANKVKAGVKKLFSKIFA